MAEPVQHLSEHAISYFDARERRLTLALRVAEVLNALVRPLLAILFGMALVGMALTGTITSGEFLGVSAVAIGYFFSSRESEKFQQRLEAQHREVVEMALHTPPPERPPLS
jgi:hypothetical protein